MYIVYTHVYTKGPSLSLSSLTSYVQASKNSLFVGLNQNLSINVWIIVPRSKFDFAPTEIPNRDPSVS